MRIAIIGSGISSLTCAYYLNEKHYISVFEKDSRIGGHTATKEVELDGVQYNIDTGFIVFNDWTYPNFIRLLSELGVQSRDSNMSFSVSCENTGLEYAGSSLNTLFCQRKNLFSPYFLRMVKDIVRFNEQAPKDLESGKVGSDMTLGDYLKREGYSEGFRNHYLIPMGAAIWSASFEDMAEFPLHFFIRFFKNHGLLNIKNRPQWKTVKGGSKSYLEPITKDFSDRIFLNSNILSVKRTKEGVSIQFEDRVENFDQVIFGCHSDQALTMLADASAEETEILGAIPYQNNDVVLHTDSRFLPKNKLARSSWNYVIPKEKTDRATLNYDMNTLQGIESRHDFLVSLNQLEKIPQEKILGHYQYSHPQFTLEGISAQQRWKEINQGNTWFCGAYWRNGFHEDGVYSALKVVNALQGATERTRILDGQAREEDIRRVEVPAYA